MFNLSAQNEAVIISFCLAALRGSGPYPVVLITGPDGSGRTTLARYLRALLDPSTPDLRNLPKTEEELAVHARDNHLMTYDDVRTVSAGLGAAICRLSKGTVFSGSRSGREQILFQGARPIILVGDDEMLLNRELVSRALVVRLDRRTTFISGFGIDFKELPQMRGALLDIVSHGLGRWGDVNIPGPIRDYEFEKWIAACELHRWGVGAFQEAYDANVSEGLTDLVELDPLLVTLRDYVRKVTSFTGTHGQLLAELNRTASIPKGSRWPTTPRALSGRLRRDAKLLLPEIEMEFDLAGGHKNDRLMSVRTKLPPQVPQADDAKAKESSEGSAARRRKPAAKKAETAKLPLFAED